MKSAHLSAKTSLTDEELLHLSRLITMGELSACFAHEVNNPLTIIRGHLRLMEEILPPDHPLRSNLASIDRAQQRIEKISKRMLEFSRKRTVRKEECDISEIITDALGVIEPYFHGQFIEVRSDVEPGLPRVAADRWQIVQAFVNLFQNAADAVVKSDRQIVTITTHKRDKFLTISVSDTGQGIAPHELPSLFKPFFTTKGENGTGLGLYIAKRVVEEHGGTITAQSAGTGATFDVTLPFKA